MSDAAEKTEVTAPPAGGGSKIVPLLLGVNSVALVGVLAVVLLRGSGGEAKTAAAAEAAADSKSGAASSEKGPGPTVKLADFTARLHGAEGDRYARISIDVEVATEKDKEEFSSRIPQVRDAFILYLSDVTLEDLTGSAAIAKTREKLTEKLHEAAPGKGVRGLFITDLVVQ
jgi:flagellar FliL protein